MTSVEENKLVVDGVEVNNSISAKELSNYAYGAESKHLFLPFFKNYSIPVAPEAPILPTFLQETCGSKIILGAVTGSVLGYALGIFLGALSDAAPINVSQGREVPQAPIREQLRAAFKQTASKSRGWAKNFGVLSALFGGVDCVVEKYRAKHDIWNPVISGCAVGAALSAKAGPTVCF